MAIGLPRGWQVENINGTPVSGAKIYTWVDDGVTTPRSLYTDKDCTVPAANPIVADSAGWWNVYQKSSESVHIVVKSADDSITYTQKTYPSAIDNAQPVDATLTALAGLTIADGDIIEGTGADAFRVTKRTVATLAALQAITSPQANDLVYMQGRASAGDGGGGFFRFATSDLSTEVAADEMTSSQGNGGIYIAPASDLTGASGAWVRQVSDNFVLPEWWGAVGDNLTDDLSAIQKAVDYCGTRGGAYIVLLTAAAYAVSGTITNNYDNVEIWGSGSSAIQGGVDGIIAVGTLLRYTGASEVPVIDHTSVAGAYPKIGGGLRNLVIDCNNAANGVRISSIRFAKYENVLVFRPKSDGWLTRAFSGALGAAPYDVQHCVFTRCATSCKNQTGNTAHGLRCTGGQGNGGATSGNTSFNSFYECSFDVYDNNPVYLEDTDNNRFFGLRATYTTGSHSAIVLASGDEDSSGNGEAARYNVFYGLEAAGGVLAKASQTGGNSSHSNIIYGLSKSNGAVDPTIETGAGGAANADLQFWSSDEIQTKKITVLGEWTSGAGASSREFIGTEIGTFTPVVEGQSSVGTATYTAATGRYERVNNRVEFDLYVNYTGHTGTGNMIISGLPFTAAAGSILCVCNVLPVNLTFSNSLSAIVQAGTDEVRLYTYSSASAAAQLAIDAAAVLYISGSYEV